MSSESTRDPPERKTIDSGIHEPRPVPSTPSTPPAPPGDDGYRPDPDRWMALGICLAAGFMTLLDVSIVNVALPSIERGLHAQSNELEWIVAGYALALGLLLVPSGRFGDAHGRRPVVHGRRRPIRGGQRSVRARACSGARSGARRSATSVPRSASRPRSARSSAAR